MAAKRAKPWKKAPPKRASQVGSYWILVFLVSTMGIHFPSGPWISSLKV